MLSLGTLVPEGPWFVFYATRCQVYWGLKQNVFFYRYYFFTGTIDLIPHIQTQITHSGASRLMHPYKYIFTPPVMCSQQLHWLH